MNLPVKAEALPSPPKLVTNLVDSMTDEEVAALTLYCAKKIGGNRVWWDRFIGEWLGMPPKVAVETTTSATHQIKVTNTTKAKGKKAIKGKSTRSSWSGNKNPLWMKQIDSIDQTKNGMDAIDGPWLKTMDDMTDINKPVLMGIRYPDKHYAVLTYEKGATARLKCSNSDHYVKDARMVDDSHSFKSMLPVLDTILS